MTEHTDRELLELAAKAIGMRVFKTGQQRSLEKLDWFFDQVGDEPPALYDGFINPTRWAPLTDDADALRLAVTLKMFVEHSSDGHEVRIDLHNGYHWTEFCNDDPYAATRRAIVRAAAEIGKAMP